MYAINAENLGTYVQSHIPMLHFQYVATPKQIQQNVQLKKKTTTKQNKEMIHKIEAARSMCI